MKKLLIVICLSMFFYIGCDTNAQLSYYLVKEKYSEVSLVPINRCCFIARDTAGNIHWIECLNPFDNDISKDIIIMKNN